MRELVDKVLIGGGPRLVDELDDWELVRLGCGPVPTWTGCV